MDFPLADYGLVWMLTYLLHSTILIAGAAAAGRCLGDRWLSTKETLWRVALFGGLMTASLQVGLALEPLSGSWTFAGDLVRRPESSLSSEVSPVPAGPARSLAALERTETVGRTQRAAAHTSIWTPAALPRWRRLLVWGWIGGAGLLVLALATSFVRLERRLRARRPVLDRRLRWLLRRLMASARIERPVRLTSSTSISVPLAKGLLRREICLPRLAFSRLSDQQQETVLAHELAHLERRDPLWLVLFRLTESLLFFQPLNRLARRRLQEIAEFRCDDWAVEKTGRPLAMARCLASVAEWSLERRSLLPAPTLAAHRRGLARRVSRLLDRRYPRPSAEIPAWLRPLTLMILVLVVAVAPSFSVAERQETEVLEQPASPPEEAEQPPAPGQPETATPAPPVEPAPAAPPHRTAPSAAPEAPTPESPATATSPPPPTVEPRPEKTAALAIEQATLEALEVALEAQMAALAVLEPQMGAWEEALEAQLQALELTLAPTLEEMADLELELAAALPSREELARLAAMAQRIAAEARPDPEDMARLEEKARRLVEAMPIDPEEIERLRQQARALVEQSLPEKQELERLQAEARRAAESYRLDAEEVRELQERAREIAERHRVMMREELERLARERERLREEERSRRSEQEPKPPQPH